MSVWHNIPREMAQRKVDRSGLESLSDKEKLAINTPPALIRLLKQREGEGWIGDVGATFDKHSHQFLEGNKTAFNYLAGKAQSEIDMEWEAGNVTRTA